MRTAIVIALLTTLTTRAAADRVVLRDGTSLEGRILSEDDVAVTVELDYGGSVLTRKIDKRSVHSVGRAAHVAPTYVTLPVVGEIGRDVTAAALRAGFNEARTVRPRYVVLAIDSSGGSVAEMFDIIDVVADASKEFHVIAFVKEAHSAAAVIAMTCQTIYLTPRATIGATVPFRVTEMGVAEIDAKRRSIFHAKTRAATAFGRHADLLIRGMQELDLEIYLATDEEGRRVLRTFGPGQVVKSKGEILTLTSDEAAECGLARTANSLGGLGKDLCEGGPWHEGTRRAWQAVAGHGARERWQDQLERERQARHLARRAAIASVKPEIDAISNCITALTAKCAAVDNAVADLERKFQWELDRIDLEYREAVLAARYQTDPNAAGARALEVRNAREASARQHLQANVAHLRAEGDAARLEATELQTRQRELLATIPRE